MAKQFRGPVSQDFEIEENNEMLGTLRIRPNGILWKPKRSQSWYRIAIEEFADYAKQQGTKVER
jgi:hypothetical protein